MAKETYIATVQIVIHPDQDISSDGEAADWFSALLSEHLTYNEKMILDWQYLKVGGQRMGPEEILVNDDYEEGDAFE